MARIRQPQPDSGLGLQGKACNPFKLFCVRRACDAPLLPTLNPQPRTLNADGAARAGKQLGQHLPPPRMEAKTGIWP